MKAKRPPWIVFDHKDGTADLLPAGRPGVILEGLPLELAQQVRDAANGWYGQQCDKTFDELLTKVEERAKSFLKVCKEIEASAKKFKPRRKKK